MNTKSNLLKVGDVIRLENGMSVNSEMPTPILPGDNISMLELIDNKVKIGKLYQSIVKKDRIIKNIALKIMSAFSSNGFEIKYDSAYEFVNSNVDFEDTTYSFIIPAGEFVVTKSLMEGGSRGGGMSGHDDWPDEPHVYCKQLIDGKYNPEGTDIDFWQGYLYDPKIKDIIPIRKLQIDFK